jgi:RNA polymerase sigma-70 factor (ECF subfamily)
LAPSTGSLAVALQHGATAAVPDALAELTVCAATRFAAGPVAAGAISASVVSLTEGVLKTMLLTKLKVTAIAISMAIGLVTIASAQQRQNAGFGQAQGEGTGVGYGAVPDSSRLREVERKLDRVLEALGATRAEPATKESRKSETWIETKTDKAANRKAGGRPGNEFQKSSTPSYGGQAQFAPAWQGQPNRAAGLGGGMASDIPDRVARLEQSLAELVDRVNRLERQGTRRPDQPRDDELPLLKR